MESDKIELEKKVLFIPYTGDSDRDKIKAIQSYFSEHSIPYITEGSKDVGGTRFIAYSSTFFTAQAVFDLGIFLRNEKANDFKDYQSATSIGVTHEFSDGVEFGKEPPFKHAIIKLQNIDINTLKVFLNRCHRLRNSTPQILSSTNGIHQISFHSIGPYQLLDTGYDYGSFLYIRHNIDPDFK